MCRSRVCWSKEWRSLPTEFSAVFAKPILRVGGTLLAIGLRIKEQVAINSGDLKWRGNGAEKGQSSANIFVMMRRVWDPKQECSFTWM